MKIKGGSNARFSVIPDVKIQRSKFNRSHGHKSTFDAGYLIPIFADEALPGDSFNLKMTAFVRMSTPLKPIIDNIYLDTFFFAVPIRLIWDNWTKFCGEQIDPDDPTDFTVPQIDAGVSGFAEGELSDYLGLPIGVANLKVSAFWHRAYNIIYNQWFRDQNLIDSVLEYKGDADKTIGSDYLLRKRNKRHDYFTSCLPWPQKGDAVSLPLGTEAPVLGNGYNAYMHDTVPYQDYLVAGSTPGTSSLVKAAEAVTSWGNGLPLHFGLSAAPHTGTGLVADLTNATAATINALRQAFQIQKLLERDARGGTRYIEIIKSHFGVTSPDFRLQRPEYLGGGSSPINITPIAQTVPVSGGTPLANLAGIGTGVLQHGFQKSFTEHCVLLGLASVRADYTYQQNLNKMFSRLTRYDFYWPSLSHLGEQAVLSKEIYCDGSGDDDLVFGYQERYAEMRYKPSILTGKMRSAATGSLDIWHLAQDFTPRPELNQAFIEENSPFTRIMAVPSEPQFIFDSHFDLICVRPMPVYSVPGLIDHF